MCNRRSNDEKKSSSMLDTKSNYGDFDLSLKVIWTGVVDSNVFLRKPELQVQLGQSNSRKIDKTCCFYTGIKGDWSAPIWYTSGYIRDPACIVAYSVGAL